ncbi:MULTISPECIES: ATP-binding protein [unclassified Pseudoalteromonas]|uniref:ATP-binding protein n=1 Tax=unclassified Pseudoalteromonas TaxID=194690 RepID=UPI003014B719
MTIELSKSPQKFRYIKYSFWLLLVIVIAVAWYVDQVNYRRLIATEKSHSTEEVNVYRTRMEGLLAENIQLVRGLGVALSGEATLSQQRFEQLAKPLFNSSEILRNIGAAPDMKLSYIYPLAGNEAALGLDYQTHPVQKYGAIRARQERRIVMAGPLELLQGGTGLIARVPVFDAKQGFWGLLSVVLDIDSLYRKTELRNLESDYLIAMRGVDGKGLDGEYFYGNQNIHSFSPLSFQIKVPSGTWVLYAVPRDGWQPPSTAIWPFRLAMLALIAIFICAFIFITRLLSQLQRNATALTNMGVLAEVGAWEVDVESREITWSDVTRSIFHVPADFQPSWMSTADFFKPGEHRQKLQEVMRNLIKTGQAFEEELLASTYDNHEVWVLIKGLAKRRGQRTSHIFGSVQNIHKRKIMELEHDKYAQNNELLAQLSASEALLNNQLEEALPLCASTCEHGLAANKISIWQLNDDASQFCPVYFSNSGSKNLEHFPPWRRAVAPALFSEIENARLVTAEQADSHPITMALSTTYLEPFDIKAMICCPISHKGQVLGLLCAEYDLPSPEWGQSDIRLIKSIAAMLGSLFSSRAQQNAKNRAIIAKDLAEQSTKMKAEFLASMSHEIRTPLNGVMGMIELAMHSTVNEDQRHQLAMAQSSAQSLLTIINDILDFSKIEAGKLHVELMEFDVIELLSSVMASFHNSARQKHNRLHIDLSGVTVSHAKSDPHRLKQILNNLLSNAIKFTQDGLVTLSCHSENSGGETQLWCSIEDTGIGIKKDKLKRIFDSFTQADLSTTREYGGTGLGLTIAKQLTALLGGDLHAFSKEGAGSTFTFHVRLSEAKAITPFDKASESSLFILTSEPLDYRKLLAPWHIATLQLENIEELLKQLQTAPRHSVVIVAADILATLDEATRDKLLSQLSQQQLTCAIAQAEVEPLPLSSLSSWRKIYYPITPDAALALFDVNKAEPAKKAQPKQLLRDVKHSPFTALLVEDNKVNQMVAQSFLQKMGAEVTLAENGELALTHLQKQRVKYDVILMDCQMPVMDGYQAAQQIRSGVAGKVHQSSFILALTANAMQGDKEKCLDAGMDDYLSKPINFDDLWHKLNLAINPEALPENQENER